MAGRKPTLELFNAIKEALREEDGNVRAVSRKLSIDYRVVKQVWEKGWPQITRPIWAPQVNRSVRDLFEDEKAQVRAHLQEEEAQKARDALAAREEEARARRDALDHKAREARAVRAAMQSGMGLLGIASELSSAMVPTIKKLSARLQEGEGEQMSLRETISTVRKLAWIGQAATTIIGRSMELERKRLGEPEAILGVQGQTFDSERAVAALGSEDEVWKAIEDLKSGALTVRAQKLLELTAASQAVH